MGFGILKPFDFSMVRGWFLNPFNRVYFGLEPINFRRRLVELILAKGPPRKGGLALGRWQFLLAFPGIFH